MRLSGAFSVAERILRSRGSFIFALHRVLPRDEAWKCYNPYLTITPESLDSFLKFLEQRFAIVEMDEFMAAIAKGKVQVCTLTFDDGWEDNFRVAYPILRARGLTATIFLPTDFIGTRKKLPEERLTRILNGGHRRECVEELRARLVRSNLLPEAALSEEQVLQSFFKRFSFDQKMSFLEWGERRNGDDDPSVTSFLDWEQVKTMDAGGMTFGSHTRRHTILPVNPQEFTREELQGSKKKLMQELGKEAKYFAYPNGMHDTVSVRLVQEAGYRAAFATSRAVTNARSDIFSLPRVPLANDMIGGPDGEFSLAMAQLSIVQTYFSQGAAVRYGQADSQPLRRIPERRSKKPSSEKPRILFMIDEMEALTAGGTERQILQMAQLVRSAGYTVQICVWRRTQWLTEETAGVPVYFAGLEGFSELSGWRALFRLISWMRSQQFDILQTFFVESNLLGPWMGKLAGIPIILGSRRNLNYWMTPRMAFFQRISNRLNTRLVANCEAVKTQIVQNGMTRANKVDVIYNGVDLDALTPCAEERARVRRELGVTEHEVLIGYIATLRPVKGTECFVAAASLVHREFPSAKFGLVGDGPLRKQLEETVSRESLSGHFVFAGSQVDVRRYLLAFDIAVLASESEGFSNSILEYVAMGLPCVVTDVGGNAEAVGPGGILVPAKNPEALALALRTLLNDAPKRAEYAKQAFAHSRKFALPATQKILSDYYRRLLDVAGR